MHPFKNNHKLFSPVTKKNPKQKKSIALLDSIGERVISATIKLKVTISLQLKVKKLSFLSAGNLEVEFQERKISKEVEAQKKK